MRESGILLPQREPDIALNGVLRQEREQVYEHVPFFVPEGVHQLLIDIDYTDRIGSDPRLSGGNTLDIGLFDERGIESRSPGFRGWSGSVQTRIVVGTESATPPYRSGKPNSGTWHLCLGPYKIGDNHLHWSTRIWLNPEIELPALPDAPNIATVQRLELPEAAEPGWYRGDLHMHSIYSDGSGTPADIAVKAVEAGLDYFGITDHNRAQSPTGMVSEGDGWPVLVPGVEVTTYAGHFNVWGTENWYDFRNPTEAGLQQAIDEALEDGGTVSINHPKPLGPEWLYPQVRGAHAIESWNGWWPRFNAASLAWWHAQIDEQGLPMVCGSDMHRHTSQGEPNRPLDPPRIGYPTLWVHAGNALTAESILAAVRAGRTFVSERPSGPQLYDHSTGDEVRVRVVGADGQALLLVGPQGVVSSRAVTGTDVQLVVSASELGDVPFVRPELHAVGGAVTALGQAIRLN